MNNEIECEIYKNFIESAEKISEKRMTQNNIYLTINLAFIAYLATSNVNIKEYFILSITGILICIIWFCTIVNYKKRNTIKYEIINNSEYGKLYKKEGEKIKKIYNITIYEKIIAILFTILYIVFFILKIF